MSEKTYQLPSNISDGLRDLWVRSRGAADVANAAQQVAKAMIEQYQSKFTDCLSMLGCDPAGKWWIDFRTGEVHEGDPPSELPPLGVGAEGNAVQTNGRAT